MKLKSILASKSILPILIALIIIPLVSANAAIDFFQNDWIQFAITFIILFGILYYFFHPKFNYNAAPTAIISIGISLLLTISITKRGILEAILDPKLVDWIVTGAIIIALIALVYWAWKKFELKGLLLLIISLGIITYLLEDYLPESLLYGPVGTIIEWVQGLSEFIFWTIIIILFILLVWGIYRWKTGSGAEKQKYHETWGEAKAKRKIAMQRLKRRRRSQQRRQQTTQQTP